MSPTRRDFFKRSAATLAAFALPMGAVAAAIPATAQADPVSIAPGVDAIDAHPFWNTVETLSIDDDPRPHLEHSWYATGSFFVQSDQVGRATQRRLDIAGYVDGSIRIAIGTTDSFDQLRVGRGFVAVHLAPDLSNEIWKGLFARSDDEVQPTAPLAYGRPWDNDQYLEGQRRIGRMQRYARTENAIEGGDEGVYRWLHPEPLKAG